MYWLVLNQNNFLSFTFTNPTAFFSPLFPSNVNLSYMVKFWYYSPINFQTGGCIGYTTYDTTTLGNFELYDDGEKSAGTMISQGEWVSCKFDVAQDVIVFRIGLVVRSNGSMGCYFDDIQIVNVTGIDSSYGQGPTCSGVVLDDLKPPGVAGYSDSFISELSTLFTAGRLDDDS